MVAIPKQPDPEEFVAPMHPRVVQEYDCASYLYFDIETIPDQRPETLERLRAEVTAPARYSKQDSIDAWLAENRESAAREALAKTSFDPAAGHVCTIGWATNDGPVRVEHAEGLGEERDILDAFFRSLPKRDVTLVGHNHTGFDIPFLTKRAILLGVELPSEWAWPRDPKPWGRGLFDTMHAWAGSGRGDMIGMNRLCGLLGIVGKEGFDGSMVADAWAAGDHLTIARYCDDDVRRTRAIHQKFLAVGY
ncbi:ribonuclease H-like domain-containing protein [Sagittula sp. S175]|uniref:ribonuclease H-like domain-containing protein n=1 Tax=Sagittula sp. S175 TaxID=3415129 RepID=UPI003C7D8DE2